MRHDLNLQKSTLFSADTSPMKVTAIVDLQIEIQGLNIEITCRVLKNLAFDLILGIDFLKQTQACIDIQTARLILQKYGVTVPLVEAKSHSQGKAASNSRIKQAKRSTDIAVVQLSLNQ
jgi:FAD synthase